MQQGANSRETSKVPPYSLRVAGQTKGADMTPNEMTLIERMSNTELADWVAMQNERNSEMWNEVENRLRSVDVLRGALKGILAEPYGCSLCHSGKLIGPDEKGHQPYCPFLLAQQVLGLEGGEG